MESLQMNKKLSDLDLFEADLKKILGYLRVLGCRCLLEAIERLCELAYYLRVCARLET